MNIKRFHAATSREALAKARMTFGEGTLILSNRATANGVEVVATAEDTLNSLEAGDMAGGELQLQLGQHTPAPAARRTPPPPPPAAPAPAPASASSARNAPTRRSVEADTEQLAMSTLSFQDYVRERMLRRRHEALSGGNSQSNSNSNAPAKSAPAATAAPRAKTIEPAASARAPSFVERTREFAVERQRETPAAQRTRESSFAAALPEHTPTPAQEQGLMYELQSMKDLIEERFNTLTWLGQARQNPIQANLMLKLIRAGYSPALSRAVLERLPEDIPAADTVRWLMEVLERNLKTDAHRQNLYEEGGIFALVGTTGVGKTTTTAKLAAMCAREYGPASVGLITLDTYRVGAHEQLRTFGRMLGVVAHLAHDQAALQDLLSLLSSKRMVLIDTSGVAPRDPRKREMLEIMELPGVQRLLVLNAGSHGDTLDDTLEAFKTDAGQQTILSKVDEAVKLGPAIDALIRHQAVLRGVTNGQRVPEDWEAPDVQQLIAASMRAPTKSAFDPKTTELNFFFSYGSNKG